MKRIVSIVLVVCVLFTSFALADTPSRSERQQTWRSIYGLIESIGDTPTKDQFVTITMYCILAQYEDLQASIESNKFLGSTALSTFGQDMDSETLGGFLGVLTDTSEYSYKTFYSILAYCSECYESQTYSLDVLKGVAYDAGYFGTDEFDMEKSMSMPNLPILGQ